MRLTVLQNRGRVLLGAVALLAATAVAGPLGHRRAKEATAPDLFFGEAIYYAK